MLEQLEKAYGRQNLDYVESMYHRYLENPATVDASWRKYFDEYEGDHIPAGAAQSPAPNAVADPAPLTTTMLTPEPGPGALPPAVLDQIPKHIVNFLTKVEAFRNIPQDAIVHLAGITHEVSVPSGKKIAVQGQSVNDLFFIRSGAVGIYRDDKEITTLGPGEMIGELAVFDERPRSADIVTMDHCALLQIHRTELQELLRRNGELTLGLLKATSARLRDMGFRQERVDQMVRAFREMGHLMADLDPLGLNKRKAPPQLSLAHYGFKDKDLSVKFSVKIGKEATARSLGDIEKTLKRIYCRSLGVQYMHIDDLEIQEWIRARLEGAEGRFHMEKEEQIRILSKLTDAETLESFIHRKFVGAKRFSLEGSESLIPLLDYAIEEAGKHKIDEVIIGMAHRGRLNVLVNILEKPARQVFREFQDVDPMQHLGGKGDVKYHLGFSSDRKTHSGHKVHLSLCFNPSHLEFVGPVVLGRVRAKQDRFGDYERARAMPLIIHGDAAIIGQGVSQEIFNMSELRGYAVGGTVHVVLNNQIGFTTDPCESRTSQYSTDVARMLQIPIFHVNGEHPEAVARVIRMAMEFREKFKKDVVIDMYGYRKYGHNEGDDPAFTQPLLYARIKKRRTVRAAYVANLLKFGGLTESEADQIAEASKKHLEEELAVSKKDDFQFKHSSVGQGLWTGFKGGTDSDVPDVDTRMPQKNLQSLIRKLSSYPDDFTPHPKIKRFLNSQLEMAEGKAPLNWGMGEALAFASLLQEGYAVRLAGQDAQRGTFSHRHSVLHDYTNGKHYVPLKNIDPKQGRMDVYNSPLTETAVVGFEYGYSLDTPDGLVIWEAQFGDFCNVAQVIFDQFISSSEEKWNRFSGICAFLPHGFEGQGPEHSSARLERFLVLSAVDNMQVVNLTTPAQLFHCLRRQILRPVRKPLIVMSPKSLLRHPKAVSPLEDFAKKGFQKIIADESEIDKQKVARVIICSGKIYYELMQKREAEGIKNVAIIRMEQYYPLPEKELEGTLKAYPKNVPVVWVQEEPLNMGAWSFLKLRYGVSVKGNGTHPFWRVTRPESASPATGSAASHKIEQDQLIAEALMLKT